MASHYLGLLYAEQPLLGKKTVIGTRAVGYSEFNARYKKMYNEIQFFSSLGLTVEVIFDENDLKRTVKKLSNEDIEAAKKSFDRIAQQAFRLTEVLKIYDYFEQYIFKKQDTMYLQLAGVYGHVFYVMNEELKSR
ncbi:hypothetical protein D3C86_1850930 [compost metagenome]